MAQGESENEKMRYYDTRVDSLTTLQHRNSTGVYKLQNTLYKIGSIIDRNDENLRALISETGDDLQQVLNINPPIQGPSNQGPGNGNISRREGIHRRKSIDGKEGR